MKAVQRFIFVNNNNYKSSSLPSLNTIEENRVYRNVQDRFRQVIGNYWFPVKKNGIPLDVDELANLTKPTDVIIGNSPIQLPPRISYTTGGERAFLTWHEKKQFPFTVKLGKTYTFSTYKTIPTNVKTTTVTLVADKIFGPYPDCITCWNRYLYGFDIYTPNSPTFERIFGFEPLKVQEIESSFTIKDPTLSTNELFQSRVGGLTPLSMLLLTDAGLPTTERLSEIGVDISYLSFGKLLSDAITRLTTDINVSIGAVQVEVPAKMAYSAKLFRDGYFDSPIAMLEEQESNLDTQVDFQNNANVEFVHNYSAKEYENYIKEDLGDPNVVTGLNDFGGETKLLNGYEFTLSGRADRKETGVILKLRNELDCFEQNLILLFRTKQAYPYDSKIIYVLAETLPLINKFYPFQEMMPYYSKISFRLQPTGPIAGAVEEAKIDGILLRHLQENTSIVETSNIRTFKHTLGKQKRKKPISLLLEENNDLIKSWGFYEWILKLGDRLETALTYTIVPMQEQDSIIINNTTLAARMMGAPSGLGRPPESYYATATAALHAKVANIVNLYSRSYPQLLKGEAPYKETIAYKIVKYSNLSAPTISSTNQILNSTLYQTLYGEQGVISAGNSTPVQEIWFFNSSKEEVINYVDTQIMNDRFYTYVVNSYVLVLESDYYYTNFGNVKPPCEDKFLDFEPNRVVASPVPSPFEAPSYTPTPAAPASGPSSPEPSVPQTRNLIPGIG
jgi:hypothetical protein